MPPREWGDYMSEPRAPHGTPTKQGNINALLLAQNAAGRAHAAAPSGVGSPQVPRGSRCSNRSPCPQAHSGTSTAATRSKPPKAHQQTNRKQSVGHPRKATGRSPAMEGARRVLRGVGGTTLPPPPPAATREAAQTISRPTPRTRMFVTGTTTRVES